MARKVNYEELILQGKELVNFYRNNPVIAAYDLLGVDLAPIQRLVFNDMWFKNYVIGVCARGFGKTYLLGVLSALSCLLYPGYRVGLIAPVFRQSFPIISDTYDTFWTSDGLQTTAQSFYGSIEEGVTKTQSLKSQNTILSKWKNPERACRSIKTTKGFTLAGTVDHSILVVNDELDLVYKELQDITEEDDLVIKKGFKYFGNDNSMPTFDEFEINWRIKDCKIPEKLTPNLAYWIGLTVGDGCVSISKDKRKQRVDFVNEDQDLLDYFEEYLSEYFVYDVENIDRRNRKNNTWEIQIFRKKLVQYLLKCGFTSTTALDKKIPNVVKKASKECVKQFLIGYMDTDGCVYIQQGNEKRGIHCEISLSTSSLQLAKEVQACFLNFGIMTNLGVSSKAQIKQLPQGSKPSKCAEAYKLRITGLPDLFRYRDEIGFRCKRKADKLNDYLVNVNGSTSSADKIPRSSQAVKQLAMACKEVAPRDSEETIILGKIINNSSNSNSITKDRIKLVLDLADKYNIRTNHYYKLKKIMALNLSFVQMTDSNYFFAPTIDAEVANESCYWSNGFISHNSKMIFSEVEKLYGKSSILKEATEKRPTRGADTCYLRFKSIGGVNGSYLEALPLGEGCVSCRNYLTFYDRFDRISNLHGENIENNHYIDRIDTVWGNGQFRESDRSLCNGVKDTIKIKTAKGFKNEGTPNHMFKVVRKGEIVWCCFDEMVIGDKVLIDRSYRWHEGNADVTEEQAYALGLFIGDGSYCNKYKLRYTTSDYSLVNCVNKGTGLEFKCVNNDEYHFDCFGKNNVSEWLSFWGMSLVYTKDKKFPQKLLSAPRNIMSAAIRGLLDSDGHIQVSTLKGGIAITIGFTNTSEELVNQLHYILLHYGIVAYKTERDRNENWNTVYELLITGSDVKIFYEEIGFGLKRKQDILKAAVKNKTRWLKNDNIPGIRKDMIKISEKNKIERGEGCKESRYCKASVLKYKKEINQYLADCFIKTYGDIDDPVMEKIKRLADPNIYYDEIVSIGQGKCNTYDIHVPDGNEYCANGFFSHNSKIRGSRFYLIVIDELAQVPDKIVDLVLRPMGSVVLEPMENVRRLEQQEMLIKQGLAVADDFEDSTVNKMVMTSSGYYKFNHMWRRMKDYWRQMEIDGDSCQYKVWQVPYWDLPSGFLEENNIIEAKRIMSSQEYRMEYEAAMISDSEGFFKASLLELCTQSSGFSLELKGDPTGTYVVGIDPNQGGSASCGVVIIRCGTINKLVNVLELKKRTTQELVMTVQDICSKYNVARIFMDKGGGGKAVMDLLEEGYGGREPIIDRTNDDHKHMQGRHILEMINFNPSWISDANFATLSFLEDKRLKFPEPPVSTLDIEAITYENIKTLKSQMLNIIVTQTSSGLLHFDTPKKGQNKDLYSALILGAYGVRMIETELEDSGEPILYTSSGMLRAHQPGATWNVSTAIGPKVGTNIISHAVLKKKIK